jgi:hypothetical protein
MVQRDLEAVKQQDAEWFRVSALDAQLALREYLEQQLFLYAKCVESEAWGLALEASKNIARVRGVDPERPAKTEGSIVELLSAAFQSARAKRLEQRQVLAVEAIPQEESALPDLVEVIPRNGKTGS